MNAAATQDVRAIEHGAAARQAAPGLDRALAAGRRDARACSTQWRAARRQPTRPERRRQDRRPGRGDHGRRLHRRSSTARWRRALGQSLLPSSTSSPAAGTRLRAASTTAGTSTSTATSAALLAKKRSKVPDRFSLTYCGKGRLGLCRSEVWNAIQAAGDQLTSDQGTANPAAWRASAIDDQFTYGPLPLVTSPYSNRPTGIQQVISFKK